jgi:hypothetical protein
MGCDGPAIFVAEGSLELEATACSGWRLEGGWLHLQLHSSAQVLVLSAGHPGHRQDDGWLLGLVQVHL